MINLHDDFFKQESKKLLDAKIIWKSMLPWASPIVVVKKYMPEGPTYALNIEKETPYYQQWHQQMAQRKPLSHWYHCPQLINSLPY